MQRATGIHQTTGHPFSEVSTSSPAIHPLLIQVHFLTRHHSAPGSAWSFDEKTGEYYLHLFCKEQPDLNWEDPDVVRAVHSVMKFWLDKGVDGFRMDVINLISKTPGLPDAPLTLPDQQFQPAQVYYANGPRLHEFLRGLRSILDQYGAFAVGEMPWVKEERDVLDAVAADRKELNMIFQFDM